MTFSCSQKFVQKDYRTAVGLVGGGLEGLCVTLCAKWCHLILSDTLDTWSNPTTSAPMRFQNFYSPALIDALGKEQRVSNARLNRMKEATDGLEKMLMVAKIMGQQGLGQERQPLIDAVSDTVPELEHRGDNIPRQILSRFGCTNVGAPAQVGWGNLANSLNEKHCYAIVFQTQNGQHAIAAYVSGGVFNHDYHIFDPNFGEFKATDKASATRLLQTLGDRYGKPQHARLFQMRL
ncbi:hypothetical protein FLL45_04410 [Aliikangiella marina]|uniref:Peptidase C58 YopT-type domain-containing protein n=1 Tax=Aliikangiella marina TaxID=1712262 RepID=A0A545TJ48_9GAMM|nr:YopT-type cysteine protease domain-containing protein [Aliikangiella marina]TQV77196.1 hypothetical protein FLL45_04410 [Aliikangiella marina]